METKEIEIKNIKVEKRLRGANEEKVAEIAESIKEVGLINEITVDKDYKLVTGLHRLEAFKLLGRDKIMAKIDDEGDPLRNELKEIDENLMRAELHYTERGDLLARRKKIYEELHPETKVGGAPGKAGGGKVSRSEENYNNFLRPSFVSDTSEKTKKSKDTITREIRISEKVAPEVKKKFKDYDIDKKTALKFTEIDQDKQQEIMAKVTKAKTIDKKKTLKNELQKLKEENKDKEIEELKKRAEVAEIKLESREEEILRLQREHEELARTHANAIKVGMESLGDHVIFFKTSKEDRDILRELYDFDEYMKINQTLQSMMISEEEYETLVRTSKIFTRSEVLGIGENEIL
jgi:Predicted transcriptional regulators